MSDAIKIPPHNLDIPRHQMPQITKDQLDNFFSWLSSKGVKHMRTTIAVNKLKATQKHFNTEKVLQMMQKVSGNNHAAIVSNDNYILDGHHRWLSDYNKHPETPLHVTKVDLPIMKLIAIAKDFEGVKFKKLAEQRLLSFKEYIDG